MFIFGIPIDNFSRKHVLHYLHDLMDEPRFHHVVTLNPEFLLFSQKNSAFREALLRADLRVADGVGLSFAFALHGETLLERFPGADLLDCVLTMAAAHGYPVFMAVRQGGLSSWADIEIALRKKYPRLEVTGRDFDLSQKLPVIKPVRSEIILCNFGAPEQEIFLANFQGIPSSLRLGIGVGGALDFLTGKIRRAPRLWQRLGLEWLWRLKEQPQRLPRILRAVFLFPARVFFEK
ncbi:MAG: WecB/TagA/CpsF family glycosyltransferase [Candidatus Moraniibacteriota bacterium]